MKVVCHLLAVATNDPEGSAMDDIVKDADKLVSCLANKAQYLSFFLWLILCCLYMLHTAHILDLLQVAKTFDFSLMGASSRSCKYVLNTLMQVCGFPISVNFSPILIISWYGPTRIGNYLKLWLFLCLQTFQNKTLAHAVRESTLDILITELLLWLLDERVPRMDDGSQLLKALNVLMLKILVFLILKFHQLECNTCLPLF